MQESEQITTDIGGWSLVPEWVLDADISDRAKTLYGILGRYADDAGACYPSRRTLADRIRCSVDSIDRATKELVDVGALSVQHRLDDEGDPTSNLYVLHRVAAAVRPPSRTGEAGGSRTAAAQNENHQEVEIQGSQESLLTAKDARGVSSARKKLGRVDRKSVSLPELELASEVLAHWNMRSGQTLTSDDWLKMIVMRIREHPDMTADDHRDLIHLTLSDPDPWWKSPSPSIIYGSGAQFERCITAALSTVRNGHHPRQEAKRFGRGLTPAQVIELTRNR